MADEQQQDIYESAISDEAPEEAVEQPTEEAPAEQSAERQRDEHGRFVKAEQEQVEEQSQPEPEPEPERESHRVPLVELLNEREKRQAEQRRAEILAQQIEQLRQQIQPPQQQIPDQFADPQAYNNYWEQRFQQQQAQFNQLAQNMRAENSLARAHDKHGDVFEKAYQAVMDRAQQGDRQAAQMIVNAPDPGTAMVAWYKREQTLSTVGDDPQAFTQRVLEEALNNPEFLAKALEKAKGVASTQPTQQIKIPPSLNKATSAARSDDTGPVSDMAMYHHAIGR